MPKTLDLDPGLWTGRAIVIFRWDVWLDPVKPSPTQALTLPGPCRRNSDKYRLPVCHERESCLAAGAA
jgi:hypothetical protein